MPRPVRNRADQLRMRPMRRRRHQLIEQRADRVHHLAVGALIASAHVVRLADPPALEHRPQRAAVVRHIQPVPHLQPVAVHRQRLARQRIRNHQRDQLLGKLIRPIVVRAVRNHRRQPIGMHPRPHQMIGRRLRRRIRAIRRIRRLLVKRRILRLQRPVHLIGRDMQKAEPRPLFARQASRSTHAPPAAGGTCHRYSSSETRPAPGSTGPHGSPRQSAPPPAAGTSPAAIPPAFHPQYRHAQTCSEHPPPPRSDSPDSPHTSAGPDSPPTASVCRSQSSTKLDPINPAPPVTKIESSSSDLRPNPSKLNPPRPNANQHGSGSSPNQYRRLLRATLGQPLRCDSPHLP